ncbi:hypothetical protein B0H13DRAFT_2240094 [Mycena leptocephala]|nr:hypothetical protein B0H13DRAFT_2240094 [Mycena leptocephala]
MPSLTVPPAPRHIALQRPKRSVVDYADLAIIDLSKAQDAKGCAELAIQTERMFDVADVPFSCVDSEEKQLYTANIEETGSYQGYKPRQYWHIDNGIHDQLEAYTINRDVTKRQHPEAVRPFLSEIEAFARHTHFNVLHPILRLIALGLELLEDALVDLHGFSSVGETYGNCLIVECKFPFSRTLQKSDS